MLRNVCRLPIVFIPPWSIHEIITTYIALNFDTLPTVLWEYACVYTSCGQEEKLSKRQRSISYILDIRILLSLHCLLQSSWRQKLQTLVDVNYYSKHLLTSCISTIQERGSPQKKKRKEIQIPLRCLKPLQFEYRLAQHMRSGRKPTPRPPPHDFSFVLHPPPPPPTSWDLRKCFVIQLT